MALEYELKFKATAEALMAIEKAFCQYPMQLLDMHTDYYETPSGVLSARHYTLRRRMENGKSVCTLKIPAGGLGRTEYEVSCGNIRDAIPLLCQAGAPAEIEELTREGLASICGAKFVRKAFTLTFPDCTLELALDKGYLIGGPRQWPFREVEVELKAGEPGQADVFALELAAKYGLITETRSKFRRALAVRQGEEL